MASCSCSPGELGAADPDFLFPQEISDSGQQPEQKGREVDPQLVEGHGVVVHGPDDGPMFHGDQAPAEQNDFFHAGVAHLRPAHLDLGYERPIVRPRCLAGLELEQIGKHGAAA